MRVPLSWLREYVDIQLTPDQLAERLTLLGMEVKVVERWGADWKNVVIGELLTVEHHPRADRLHLTTVNIGRGEPLQIVCGANNIAPGQRIPVALPGAVLPGDRRIERTEKMGIVSDGMLCSGDELRLTGDGEGILVLPSDLPLGAALSDLYGDVILDVDVKPNRGDALSILGLAREVAAVTGAPVRWPAIEVAESGQPVGERLSVSVEDGDLCTRFVGRWVSGVRVGQSPDQVQMRLLAAGLRPVSNVVDASNYVMLEMGKPIHTFDAAAVRDGRIVVRRARPGERIETLDHVERTLTDDTLLIADSHGPLAIAGVMGGAGSEIGRDTTEVIIESAVFDPISIRRAGQRYALRSEASLRFEKGQEPRLARIGADRCAQLVAAWSGGTVAPGRVDTAPDEPVEARVAFRPARVNRLLGTALTVDEQRELLGRVGVATEVPAQPPTIVVAAGTKPLTVPSDGAETLLAVVPTWRRDILIEADIAEEVARVRGYELVPAMLPRTSMPAWRPDPLELRNSLRETMAGAGVSEVVTLALVSPRHLDVFGWSSADVVAEGEVAEGGDPITVTNPLSSEHALLRQGLLGSLADVVSSNLRHGRSDIAIFEVGKGYGRTGNDTREWWRLGLALAGLGDAPGWNRPARPVDLDDAKGLAELLCRRLGLTPVWQPLADERVLHPGRAARLEGRDPTGALRIAGRVGELHPGPLEAWELRTERLVVAELSISGLSGGPLPAVRSHPPARFQASERDLAIVVAGGMPAAAVEAAIRTAGGRAPQGPGPVRHLHRPAPGPRRAEPGVPAHLLGAGPDPHRGRDRGGRQRGHRGAARRRRRPDPVLSEPPPPRTSVAGVSRHGSSCPIERGAATLRPAGSSSPAVSPSDQGGRLGIGDFIDSIDLFDLLVALALIGMFVLGYVQGVIRRLIGLASVTFAFILAANLRGPFGDFLATNWTQFPGDYSRMIGFGVVFAVAVIGLALAAQMTYKPLSLWPSMPLVEDVIGGFLGVVQGMVILLALIVITDPYFASAGAPANNELPFLRTFHDLLDGSATANVYRQTLIPGFNALFGAFLPDVIKAAFPGGGA